MFARRRCSTGGARRIYKIYDIGALVYSFYVLQEAHNEALCVLHADSVMVSKLEIKCHPRMIISKNNTAPPADSRHALHA
jgi:hypothetical protein